jgi:hypothetical protein
MKEDRPLLLRAKRNQRMQPMEKKYRAVNSEMLAASIFRDTEACHPEDGRSKLLYNVYS